MEISCSDYLVDYQDQSALFLTMSVCPIRAYHSKRVPKYLARLCIFLSIPYAPWHLVVETGTPMLMIYYCRSEIKNIHSAIQEYAKTPQFLKPPAALPSTLGSDPSLYVCSQMIRKHYKFDAYNLEEQEYA